MRFILFSLLMLLSVWACAQKFTISGYVSDSETGEKLISANVFIPGSTTGTTTNVYGFYSLTLPAGKITLSARYIGYQVINAEIDLIKSQPLDFILSASIQLKEVEIVETRTEKIQERSQMSAIEIPVSQIKAIPAMFGEVDVLKAIQLLPGVHGGSEGQTGIYVRGGGPDQNLILLDGAPVYNPSHLLGFFSVFNADAIKNVTLIKGGFPARYGGRLSSVIDINMKEGNTKKISGEGSIGIISSKLALEGPLFSEKTSFIISARRTYLDILTRPLIRASSNGDATGGLYFYDLNGKVNHKFSDKDHLYLSAYTGKDRFFIRTKDEYEYNGQRSVSKNQFGLDWGNITSTLRWNHVLSNKLFLNTSLIFSRYQFNVGVENSNEITFQNTTNRETFKLNYYSGINDVTGKVDFDYYPNPNHFVKFGGGYIYHTFHTGALQFKFTENNKSTDTTVGPRPIYAGEYSLYVEDDFKPTDLVKINAGIHSSAFNVKKEFYYSVQPRISARYIFTEDWALKASFATMTQYIHLLSNYGVGLPTDLWVPSTPSVKPQQSWQGAVGVARTIFNEQYELSIEGFYKEMKNLIEYKEGAGFMEIGGDWQTKIESGKGTAYGSEFFIQKKEGKLTGWIGYTLAWTNRQFENLNFGKVFPYKYDRRHDVSIVASYKLNKKINVSLTWVYGTGNAATLELANYKAGFDGTGGSDFYYYDQLNYYGERNSFRMKAYHRLDLGIDFIKVRKRWTRTWSVGAYNAYNRKNPYFMYFGNDDFGNPALYQVSLFPVIPSISYSFKF